VVKSLRKRWAGHVLTYWGE